MNFTMLKIKSLDFVRGKKLSEIHTEIRFLLDGLLIDFNDMSTLLSSLYAQKFGDHVYDTKQSVMLELWGMQSAPSLPSLPVPLWVK